MNLEVLNLEGAPGCIDARAVTRPPAVPYTDFPAQFAAERREILAAVEHILAGGSFILGEEVARFEAEFAAWVGARHAVGVANGTDALILTFKALGIGPGHEVITAPNSWISSASSIALCGARPVFADVGADLNIDTDAIERAITPRTRALLPVHLTGRCANMTAILDVARRHHLLVVEDAAQAVGARHRDRAAGSFGMAACFSLHPLKNLNAAGDAGVITTSDDALAAKLRLLRNHGLQSRDRIACWGYNSRLDALQAAILRLRLLRLDEVIAVRRRNAAWYGDTIGDAVECPTQRDDEWHTYHLFVIQCDRRNALQAYLAARGIDAKIHYPIPLHLQECTRALGYRRGDFPVAERQAERILSLPVHQFLSREQLERVAESIHEFFAARARRCA